MTEMEKASVLVVGGGISGVTAALEAAESGREVVLVEKNPYLGGRVAQLYQYFPKFCPPYCGLEINFKRLKANPKVRILTLSEVAKIEGSTGDYTITIKQNPRFVNDKCTMCGKCSEAVEATIDNPFNYGMDKIKAAYLPHEMAFPALYVIDPSIAGTADGEKAKAACPYGAVDMEDAGQEYTVNVGSIVWAAGWKPYDPEKLETYNFNQSPNLITNVQMERLASPGGPTKGKILKPGDGQPPASVAFIQCAGSRDENHLPYCSTICCLASLKQATYLREQLPDTKVTIYFIDIRAMDRNEDVYTKVKDEGGVEFVKSKIAKIGKNADGMLILEGEDTTTGGKFTAEHDMVVLATGMQPNTAEDKVPVDGIVYDDYGFLTEQPGIVGAGCVRAPRPVVYCVQGGTAAALKAINQGGGR